MRQIVWIILLADCENSLALNFFNPFLFYLLHPDKGFSKDFIIIIIL